MEVEMWPGVPSASPPAVLMVNDDECPSLAGIGKEKNHVWKGQLSFPARAAVYPVMWSVKAGLLFPHFQTYSLFPVWGTSQNSTCSVAGEPTLQSAALAGWSFYTANKDSDFIKFPPTGHNPGTVTVAGEWISQESVAESPRTKTIPWHSMCFYPQPGWEAGLFKGVEQGPLQGFAALQFQQNGGTPSERPNSIWEEHNLLHFLIAALFIFCCK